MYDILTVYHGGTEIVSHLKVDVGRPNLDFGPDSMYLMFFLRQKIGQKRLLMLEKVHRFSMSTI